MPQFQIRRHPHGGTWQTFYLNCGPTTFYEGNTVQECIDHIVFYLIENTWVIFDGMRHTSFRLEVLPD